MHDGSKEVWCTELRPRLCALYDCIAVLLGGSVPYVLSPVEGIQLTFQLVGEYYVRGQINEEAFHHLQDEVERLGGKLPPTSHGPRSTRLEKLSLI